MRNESELASKNLELSFEFSRYVLSHPELEDRLPENALVVFEVEEDPELTEYNRLLSERNRESHQPVVIIRIKALAPTRLIEPHVSLSEV